MSYAGYYSTITSQLNKVGVEIISNGPAKPSLGQPPYPVTPTAQASINMVCASAEYYFGSESRLMLKAGHRACKGFAEACFKMPKRLQRVV